MPRDKPAMLIVKPEGIAYQHAILQYLNEHNFVLAADPLPLHLKFGQASRIYAKEKVEDSAWNPTPYWQHVTSGLSVVVFLRYRREIDDAQDLVKRLLGNKNPDIAHHNSLRYKIGKLMKKNYETLYVAEGDYYLNAVHAAKNILQANEECRVLLGKGIEEYLSNSGRVQR